MRTSKQIADDLKKNLVNFAPESDPVLKHGRTIMEQCIAEAMLEAWKEDMTEAHNLADGRYPASWMHNVPVSQLILEARDAKTEI